MGAVGESGSGVWIPWEDGYTCLWIAGRLRTIRGTGLKVRRTDSGFHEPDAPVDSLGFKNRQHDPARSFEAGRPRDQKVRAALEQDSGGLRREGRGRCLPSLETNPSLRNSLRDFNNIGRSLPRLQGRSGEISGIRVFRVLGGLRIVGWRIFGGGLFGREQMRRGEGTIETKKGRRPGEGLRPGGGRATSGTRTLDFSFTKAALYQLS